VAADRVERRLAAILAADVAGYSRLMGVDEEGTLRTLTRYREVLDGLVEEHQGRVVASAGDSVLAEFGSAVQAVRAAVAVQRALDRRNADLPEARRMRFRIGINVGDVMVQGGDLLGDGVNVAARLEQLAEPGGILVSGAVFEQIQGKLDFPCAFAGERTVKNITRPIHTWRIAWDQSDAVRLDLADPATTPVLPDKPSIAVLPFANMGSDPEQDYFADGISEDIITALSKSRWLFVIARNSSFAYKSRSVDIREIGRDLGVRYVLEGSVRKAGNRVRITAQLIEASSGGHVWSERYDRDLEDTFAVQDEITESVVGAIEPELLQVERQRAARKSPERMDAWDHYMRGMWRFHQFDEEGYLRAERLLGRAIELDPTLAQAHMGLARIRNGRISLERSTDPGADLEAAWNAARRALALDDKEPYTHYILAWIHLFRRSHEDGLAAAQKAIDLTPNFALAYYMLGVIRVFLGHFEQAADPLRRAMRLSPHEPLTFMFANYMALAEYHQGRYEATVRAARAGLAVRPTHMLHRTLAAALGQLGRMDEAATALAEKARLQRPNWHQLQELANPYADPVHAAHLAEGLAKAGMAD
jgi:TolB-like protein/class 3 adenylate cyclase/tetratricopeptide (TPR) repeat protein